MESGSSLNRIIYPPIDPCIPYGGTETNNISKTIEIFNFYGEKVYSQTQLGNEFDVSELKRGFYIVRSTTMSGKVMTKKLLVE